MSEFIGYNPKKVEELRNSVNVITPKIASSIVNQLKDNIVTPMSQAWYTPEGKEFFNAFAQTVKNAGPVIDEVLNAFIKGVETAANNWAENVKAKPISLKKISSSSLKLNVSAIQEKNKAGDVGIDEAAAMAIANKIPVIRTQIQSELTTHSKTLIADSAFLGKGQSDSVENCFQKIQDEVAKIFKFLDEDGEGQSLMTSIKNAVTKYGDVGTSTSGYFKG